MSNRKLTKTEEREIDFSRRFQEVLAKRMAPPSDLRPDPPPQLYQDFSLLHMAHGASRTVCNVRAASHAHASAACAELTGLPLVDGYHKDGPTSYCVAQSSSSPYKTLEEWMDPNFHFDPAYAVITSYERDQN